MTRPTADYTPNFNGEHYVRTRPILLVILVASLAFLAACSAASQPPVGSDAPVTGDPDASQAPGAPAANATLTIVADEVAGPAVQVGDALRSDGEPVRVAGALFVDAEGRVLLCSAVAESFPPQCGGDRLAVVGLELDSIADLQEANGVRWAEGVELSGTVD